MKKGRVVLVLGGARSGKSAFAEKLLNDSGLQKIYLATAQVFDSEMAQRVALHHERRGSEWQLVEEPTKIAEVIANHDQPSNGILVDCLTLWVTNLMMADLDIGAYGDRLVESLKMVAGTVVFVSNEVGQGIVPDNAMARAFRDYAGILHQKIAAIADEVYFVTAGLPQKLKG